MRTTRKGHSQRKAQSQKYYLVVRYRCAVLNSLRAKKNKNKKAVMLKYNTVSQNHECYIKTSEKKAYTKTLHCNRTAIQTNELDLANNSEGTQEKGMRIQHGCFQTALDLQEN